MEPLNYRVNDFSKSFGISRTSIYDLIKTGKLRVIRVAGRTLIPAAEAQRLIREAMQ